jgi:hypothetical protein
MPRGPAPSPSPRCFRRHAAQQDPLPTRHAAADCCLTEAYGPPSTLLVTTSVAWSQPRSAQGPGLLGISGQSAGGESMWGMHLAP